MDQPPAPAAPNGVDAEVWNLHLLAANGDTSARAELVVHYQPYARSLATKAYRGGEPVDDLAQVAVEGLLLALDRYDPARGIPFLGFAAPTIMGTLKRHFRDNGWAIRVPRAVHDLSPAVRRATEMLEQDLGRLPLPGEVADLLGVSIEVVEEVTMATLSRSTRSVDDPDLQIDLSFFQRDLGTTEDRVAIERALGALGPEERLMVVRYFRDQRTQTEIAAEIGRSQIHVSRVLARTLSRLRSHLC